MKTLILLLISAHLTHLSHYCIGVDQSYSIHDAKGTRLSVFVQIPPVEKNANKSFPLKSYSSYHQVASTFALDFSNDYHNEISPSSITFDCSTELPISSNPDSPAHNNDQNGRRNAVVVYGGISRMDTTKKEIYLVFTGHEFADGGDIIIKTLKKQNIQASFFFTGDFYRTEKFAPLIKKLKENGHYLGAHSDKHLLYSPWEKRDSLLIDKTTFTEDLNNNYKELKKFGINSSDAHFFLPPYEWYNQTISHWTNERGLEVVNFTGGTYSNADYTTPDMPNYISSDTIFARIMRYESTSSNGLNGFLLLTHFGTHELRTDKFYNKLDRLIVELKKRGYSFKRLQSP